MGIRDLFGRRKTRIPADPADLDHLRRWCRTRVGVEAFLEREVLPYAPDAWFDPASAKVGYEISFNRYFYKPAPMRTLEEIRADILAVRKESEGLLDEILGGT